jgi:hypothetical protein
MKNLFLLTTEKPSRLSILNNGELNFGAEFISSSNSVAKHIYITNSEKIKEGVNQWYFDKTLNKPYNSGGAQYLYKQNVIVLTTDKGLIADGVQSIPDEFLEWFVKNSNCEEIEFEKFHGINTSIAEVNAISGDGSLNWQGKSDLRDYKIIIPRTTQQIIDEDFSGGLDMGQVTPKEEPKQYSKYLSCCRSEEECHCKEEPKQETLQEVVMYHQELFNYLHGELGTISLESEMQEIERIVLKNYNINALNFEIDALKREIKTLKNQQEQDKNKYSDEDMIRFVNLYSDIGINESHLQYFNNLPKFKNT